MIDAEYSDYCLNPTFFRQLTNKFCSNSFSLLPTIQIKRERHRKILSDFLETTKKVVIVPGNKVYLRDKEKNMPFRNEMKRLVEELSLNGTKVFVGTEKNLNLVTKLKNKEKIVPFALLNPNIKNEIIKLKESGFKETAIYTPFYIVEKGNKTPQKLIKYVERREAGKNISLKNLKRLVQSYIVAGTQKEIVSSIKKLSKLSTTLVFHPLNLNPSEAIKELQKIRSLI